MLGFGAATINSYEQGELPTDAGSNLIRLAEDAAVFARLFSERASLLGPTQRKRIEKKIENLILSPDTASTGYRITDAGGILCSEVPDEYRGFRAPDAERLYALLAAILVCLDTPVFKTKLLKHAFLALCAPAPWSRAAELQADLERRRVGRIPHFPGSGRRNGCLQCR